MTLCPRKIHHYSPPKTGLQLLLGLQSHVFYRKGTNNFVQVWITRRSPQTLQQGTKDLPAHSLTETVKTCCFHSFIYSCIILFVVTLQQKYFQRVWSPYLLKQFQFLWRRSPTKLDVCDLYFGCLAFRDATYLQNNVTYSENLKKSLNLNYLYISKFVFG